ncbi:MAG: 50S ribosomal protein L29 [Candidatus Firestonebacteria bacterium]
MKAKEIRDLTIEEIKMKVQDIQKELVNLKIKLAMKSLENPNKVREAKRNLARMFTILKEKEKNKLKE